MHRSSSAPELSARSEDVNSEDTHSEVEDEQTIAKVGSRAHLAHRLSVYCQALY